MYNGYIPQIEERTKLANLLVSWVEQIHEVKRLVVDGCEDDGLVANAIVLRDQMEKRVKRAATKLINMGVKVEALEANYNSNDLDPYWQAFADENPAEMFAEYYAKFEAELVREQIPEDDSDFVQALRADMVQWR